MESQPCAVCDIVGHPTHICLELDELKLLLRSEKNIAMKSSRKKVSATKNQGKALCTNHACTICKNYGHYTHHCPKIPRYRNALHALEQSYQEDPSIHTNGE